MKKTLLICAAVFSCLFTACSNNDVLPENMTTRFASGDYISNLLGEDGLPTQRQLIFDESQCFCVINAKSRESFKTELIARGVDVSKIYVAMGDDHFADKPMTAPFDNSLYLYNVSLSKEELEEIDDVIFAGSYYSVPDLFVNSDTFFASNVPSGFDSYKI